VAVARNKGEEWQQSSIELRRALEKKEKVNFFIHLRMTSWLKILL
jgi:hypothetical protein